MEIVRIPRTYSTQIQYLSDKDMSYIFKNLFLLSEGEVIDVEDSMRGGLLKSIWREVVQMENKARAKKGEKRLNYELATLRVDTESDPKEEKSATKSKQVKTIQDKSIQIVSKETELKLKPITIDLNNLILEIKEVCNEYGLAYNKTRERQFAKHILTAKDYGEFAEKVGLDRVRLAKNIIVLSQKWWKGPCTGPEGIYKNYASVFNECKMQKQKEEIKIDAQNNGYNGNIIYTDEI